MSAKAIADRYIARDGGPPAVVNAEETAGRTPATADATVTIPLADYRRLLESAQVDDDIEWCEACGAWMGVDDPACVMVDDFRGCWKAATGDSKYDSLCRSYRVIEPKRTKG